MPAVSAISDSSLLINDPERRGKDMMSAPLREESIQIIQPALWKPPSRALRHDAVPVARYKEWNAWGVSSVSQTSNGPADKT